MGESARMVFAERLRELRTKERANQKEFAARIGISAATLSAYENGSKSPVIATAAQIAKACDVSLNWLCGLPERLPITNTVLPGDEKLFIGLANFILKFDMEGCSLKSTIKNFTEDNLTVPEEWTMNFDCDSINRFITSVNKLCSLKLDNILDDDLMDACIEAAAKKALKEYNDEIHMVDLISGGPELPFELILKDHTTFENEKPRPGATNTGTGS